MNKSTTKLVVATGLGAALFMVLFMFVKVPSPVPETNFQIAYGVQAFFATLFGPVCGFLIGFIGHAVSDATQYGSPWWSWVVASGLMGLIVGLASKKLAYKVEEGQFGKKEILTFAVYCLVASVLCWLVVAPVLDIVVYSEAANSVFAQGVIAAIMDFVSAFVVGLVLLKAYAATRTQKGSLSKDN